MTMCEEPNKKGARRGVTVRAAVCLFGAALLAGCRTYEQKVAALKVPYAAGDIGRAAEEARRRVRSEGPASRDGLLWRLEAGGVLRTARAWEESRRTFDEADGRLEEELDKAKVSVSGEALALFTNPATLPYRGMFCDGIMLSAYQALNAMQTGDMDAARTALERCYERQQDAVESNARRIQASWAAVARDENGAAIQRARDDPRYAENERALTASLPDTAGYENYVNPFATYLDALFHAYRGEDASDFERARKSFGRAASFAPGNAAVLADYGALTRRAAPPAEPCVYVIFETGLAPFRHQVRIDVPIVVSRVSYVGIAFPALRTVDSHVPYLTAAAPGIPPVRTETVCSMDKIVAQEFKNDFPVIMTRAIASATAKAIAAYAAGRAARESGNDWVWLTANIFSTGYQIGSNVADTRSWTLLPKEFQVCRLPMPAGRAITVAAAGGPGLSVQLAEGRAVVVYVRSVSPRAPLVVSQFVLRK